MGWFWADADTAKIDSMAACPVTKQTGPGCPVNHGKSAEPKEIPAVCPVNHEGQINPLNNMPKFIPSGKLPGQKMDLPTERVISSIPRGEKDNEGYWEYPSPQQMFNAMMRKGKADGVQEDAVESMVDVHNFLNEAAWQQILEWENDFKDSQKYDPRLLKFTGRPHDLSPRARSFMFLAKLFPNTFDGHPPFDRHDWTVLRDTGRVDEKGNKVWKPVRYVIDYYGGPETEEGVPTFSLDVRPALDDPSSALHRFKKWSGPLIHKALGDTEA